MQPHPTPLAAHSTAIAQLAQAAAPSAVTIHDHGRSVSGLFWRPDIVVAPSDAIEARTGATVRVSTGTESQVEGHVIGHDPTTDIALIRTVKPGTPVSPGTEGPLSLGETVVAIGRIGHGPTCATGTVSLAGGPWHSLRGGALSQRVWLDMRLPRQSEGAAIVDMDGHCRGMAVFGPRRRVVLIPADTIERVGQELVTHGRIRRGYLGVNVQPVAIAAKDVDQCKNPTGLMIIGLDAAGPAAKAGLHQGDIIVAIGGQPAHAPKALMRLLPSTSIGQSIAIDRVRAGQASTVQVTVGESPAA